LVSNQSYTKILLAKVAFHANRLSSSIPESWWKSTSLKYLDVSENSLTGTLPTWIDLPELNYLYLNNNSLTGSLPQTLPINLFGAWFQDNNFTGTIPATFGVGLNALSSLRLQGNRISGTIPKELCLVRVLEIDCLEDSSFGVDCRPCSN
jgi:Leucine-rich repeat (LRR) protein